MRISLFSILRFFLVVLVLALFAGDASAQHRRPVRNLIGRIVHARPGIVIPKAQAAPTCGTCASGTCASGVCAPGCVNGVCIPSAKAKN